MNDRSLLLHLCCAPCAEYPLQRLRTEYHLEPVGYYFNPNIQPLEENRKRAETVRTFAALKDLPVVVREDCEEDRWRSFASRQKADHCGFCYARRFNEAARYAAEQGFSAFTSTLFVSPYQDYERMVEIARRAAAAHRVEFLEIDFRPGYRQGQEMAKADGLYRQKFCGCIYSIGESAMKAKILRQLDLREADIPDREP